MNQPAFDPASPCPDPLTRAPRRAGADDLASGRLHVAPPALQGALVVLLSRDTRHLALDDAQRLSHFPASPLVTLSWFHDLDVGLVRQEEGGPAWQPFGGPVVIAGSQSAPSVSWAPTTGRGYVACFTPDVAQALFGVDLAAIHDRFLPVHEVIDARWQPLWDDLLKAADDAAALAALERHLAAPWRTAQGPSALPALRQLGRYWVEKLGLQAQEWRRQHSERHVERRLKTFTGRSLRQWQALTRTEGLFFAARELHEKGLPVNWADLAQEEGFTDQAHMIRASKRITGFTPGEFAQRYMEDESFWMYRLWV